MASFCNTTIYIQVGVMCVLFSFASNLPSVVNLGGLLNDDDKEVENAFQHGVDEINEDSSILPTKQLSMRLSKLKPQDTFHTFQAACQQLSSGIIGFIGPTTLPSSSLIQSVSTSIEIPHVRLQSDYIANVPNGFSLNLHPSSELLSKAFRDILDTRGWMSYTIVYESNEALIKLKKLLERDTNKSVKISFRQLKPGMSYKKLAKDIGKQGEANIVLDISTWKIKEFFKQAQDIGMMTEYHSYLVTSLDLHTVDLREFQRGRTNITAFRLVSSDHEKERQGWEWAYEGGQYKKVSQQKKTLKTKAALVHDAVKMFALSLHNMSSDITVRIQSIFCDSPEPWTHGNHLLNIMKETKFKGLTGFVEFDQNGTRTNFSLDILELKEEGLRKVGTWNTQFGIQFSTKYEKLVGDVLRQLRNRTLEVVTIINPPYMMMKEPAEQLTGNDQFEGYCLDLLEELSKRLGFKYKIHQVRDGSHGSKNEHDEWNGMIRELINKEADLALADLTITYEREEAVDFTMPFMNLGISILFRTPTKNVPKLFSFLSPLSLEVWMYMATTYLGVSLLFFLLARLTPYEWVPSNSCNPDSNVLENQFSLSNSFWFTIGSLMQQGTEIAPKAISTRVVAIMWWFFTLIMISSYTANLAAFLTVQRMESPIESANDLAKQSSIQYGCLKFGSTKAFFKESNIESYKTMWRVMQSQPTVFTESNLEGVERVLRGNYAYLMESASIEYITARNCELEQIDGLLDSKGYGIATPKGSPYRTPISNAILELQEDGILYLLKEKWWFRKYGGHCKHEETSHSASTNELGLANVGGVFVVLLTGLGLACMISMIEFILKTRRSSRNERDSVLLDFQRKARRIGFRCGLTSHRAETSSWKQSRD
ncbi:glutamate receptor ionotropic, kainate 1-like [Limulus polyphemus]|uniref:Glutamate receptor ionotropic, kainate 1-like n=1 Tax=Limulus polyphemus TaxID=6850 RepID=A0ABM1SUH5_LIMPO|nr:glutamate receptor ionotropic, kainate 1-like [Limulus polyphemus]